MNGFLAADRGDVTPLIVCERVNLTLYGSLRGQIGLKGAGENANKAEYQYKVNGLNQNNTV